MNAITAGRWRLLTGNMTEPRATKKIITGISPLVAWVILDDDWGVAKFAVG